MLTKRVQARNKSLWQVTEGSNQLISQELPKRTRFQTTIITKINKIKNCNYILFSGKIATNQWKRSLGKTWCTGTNWVHIFEKLVGKARRYYLLFSRHKKNTYKEWFWKLQITFFFPSVRSLHKDFIKWRHND